MVRDEWPVAAAVVVRVPTILWVPLMDSMGAKNPKWLFYCWGSVTSDDTFSFICWMRDRRAVSNLFLLWFTLTNLVFELVWVVGLLLWSTTPALLRFVSEFLSRPDSLCESLSADAFCTPLFRLDLKDCLLPMLWRSLVELRFWGGKEAFWLFCCYCKPICLLIWERVWPS